MNRIRLIVWLTLIAASAAKGAGPRPKFSADSWSTVLQHKGGTIVLYWHESRPFIFKSASGRLEGLEFGIIREFEKFVEKKYGCDLNVVWREADSFADTYETLRDSSLNGFIGSSAFSITEARSREVDFSPTYMSDISVLVTSGDVPIVNTLDEFNSVFADLTAITIKQTTYESELRNLRDKGKVNFNISYIDSRQNILRTIEQTNKSFGFIDLPVYMMMFNENPMLKVNRQNLFTIKRSGYAFPLPKGSDWNIPLREFFSSKEFAARREQLIANYIDSSVFKLVEKAAIEPNELVLLLEREKEIQFKKLVGATADVVRETKTRNFMAAFASVVVFCLGVIGIQYRKRSVQQRRIEIQRKAIEQKNKQLEIRNRHLLQLDEEKNNLIKILAHDLRTPINHVQGLAHVFLLSNKSLPEDQKQMIHGISDASSRLSRMISNILDIDSIENNRVRLNVEKLGAGGLVEKVVKSFENESLLKKITLVFRDETQRAFISADPLFLTQVLENLISNALKFSPAGLRVEVTTTRVDDEIHISVKDSGPGLTDEDKRLLFTKFQRLSAKPTGGENSIGLGLSIVKRYVELMGGKVWCSSRYGAGATFTVAFKEE